MEVETSPTALSLSDLPENVIEEILCCLPIKEAVGTGILSRFWHRRWESIPYLDFSDNWRGNDPLLSILRSFPCLTYLELSSCNYMTVGLEEDYFSGSRFTTALRTLQLDSCPLSGKFSLLISACPLLETLILRNVGKIYLEDTHSEIVAPNLRRLVIDRVSNIAADFLVMTAPVLETAVINFVEQWDVTVASTTCNLMKFLAGMPCIRKLELSDLTLMFLGGNHILETIPICLNQLRFMLLCGYGNIKNVPGHGQNFWKTVDREGLFDKLETVKMIAIDCVEAEHDFIQFVLADMSAGTSTRRRSRRSRRNY